MDLLLGFSRKLVTGACLAETAAKVCAWKTAWNASPRCMSERARSISSARGGNFSFVDFYRECLAPSRGAPDHGFAKNQSFPTNDSGISRSYIGGSIGLSAPVF